jgi:hypothetical protein
VLKLRFSAAQAWLAHSIFKGGYVFMMLSLFLLMSIYGFNPAQATNGNLTISIAEIGQLTELEKEIPVIVTLSNKGSEAISGELSLDVIDQWRIVGEPVQEFNVSPNEQQEIKFICIPGNGTYAAHYPIHATAIYETESGTQSLHTVLVTEVTREAVLKSKAFETQQSTLKLDAPGRLSLLSLNDALISFRLGENGEVITMQPEWSGSDPTTGTNVDRTYIDRGDQRAVISVHPPWREGWGVVWSDYMIQLPDAKPLFLDFATAIRDNVPDKEPPSDGVQFQVYAAPTESGEFKLLFDRFSDAKRWEEARVDLSEFAGQKVYLRLLTSPGPKHDTTCDQSYWADPIIIAGIEPFTLESDQEHQQRIKQGKESAQKALKGESVEYSWSLADNISASLVPGQFGIIDSVLTFATPKGDLTIDGFNVDIDERQVGNWRSGFSYGEWRLDNDVYKLPIKDGDNNYEIAIRAWNEGGSLRFQFALEGIQKDFQGKPNITHVSLGSIDQKVHRLYGGHGNVLQEPGKLRLGYDGFTLSTSFAGFDFANGISLVQATDIPPDAVRVDPERGIATLDAHHDVTFTFVLSTEGAFDGARKYREIVKPQMSPGVPKLLGKMCLDQWSGNYTRNTEGLERAARYGLTDSIFVEHVWQRWGYDYRLPDIYPPAGNRDDFLKMVDACKKNGILFAPHDNYIDFYPDATGFSYQHIIFNGDGTPQRAWYNEGRKAQSYRWLPHAFFPWMEDNLQLIRDGFAPTGYFIDVFSAITPMDYYDENGQFYPKTDTIQAWGEAFDRVREIFDGALTISEAGHDALIGHLDSAEADHLGWTPESRSWAWNVPAEDGERIPWHDMVTHGKFVLLAGGLGSRYSGSGSREMHGYGSDDYLNMTVLGGRSPMCDGPFNRNAVMTYWLLHDVCAELAKQDMEKHTFAEDDIHRQVVEFSNGGKVIANRGKSEWDINGQVLPSYGFVAKSGEYNAMVTKRDGIISAYSESPNSIFVDARPPEHSDSLPLQVEITSVESLEGRRFALLSKWSVQSPINEQGKTFIHFTNSEVAPDGEHIAFQANFPLGPEQWGKAGVYEIRTEAELPENLPLGEYRIRYGIYQPENGGERLILPGRRDSTGRSVGGSIVFGKSDDDSLTIQYKSVMSSAIPDEFIERLNVSNKVINFGLIETNGAFRLLKDQKMLIPLPESNPFEVVLDLNGLKLPVKISRIEALNENLEKQEDVEFSIDGGKLKFSTKVGLFAYRLVE